VATFLGHQVRADDASFVMGTVIHRVHTLSDQEMRCQPVNAEVLT
jgi:hypothetical protein